MPLKEALAELATVEGTEHRFRGLGMRAMRFMPGSYLWYRSEAPADYINFHFVVPVMAPVTFDVTAVCGPSTRELSKGLHSYRVRFQAVAPLSHQVHDVPHKGVVNLRISRPHNDVYAGPAYVLFVDASAEPPKAYDDEEGTPFQ